MKKSGVFLILCLLLSSCANLASSNETELTIESNIHSEQYNGEYLFAQKTVVMDAFFYEQISSNPIDMQMKLENVDSGSEQRIAVASAYADAWNEEIKHSLQALKGILLENDYEDLVNAYSAMKTSLESMKSVEQSVFYIGSAYNGTANSDTYPAVMEVYATRTKDYAVEILSLEYALTGKIDFVFGVETAS